MLTPVLRYTGPRVTTEVGPGLWPGNIVQFADADWFQGASGYYAPEDAAVTAPDRTYAWVTREHGGTIHCVAVTDLQVAVDRAWHVTADDGTTAVTGSETPAWTIDCAVIATHLKPRPAGLLANQVCGATAWVDAGHGLAEPVRCDLPRHHYRLLPHLDRTDVDNGTHDQAWAWFA